MAQTLWGKVYFKDTYAGRLQEEPGGRIVFTYDTSYLEGKCPAISHTLPLRSEPYISEYGLHPFFDNLVAEGWLRNAQARVLGVNLDNRFALLLGFGFDLAGAVSVIDPEPQQRKHLDHTDEAMWSAVCGRASLSGVQRKLLVVKDGGHYRPVHSEELSTHIAKLPSGNLTNLIELEYISTLAFRSLLPHEDAVKMEFAYLPSVKETSLIISRFDRTQTGKRIHFEEFNQLLGRSSGDDKYEGNYEEMGQFIQHTQGCMPAEAHRLLQRILACLLIGDTDAHYKNFAMFHTRDGLRLTPAYDIVASSLYKEYQAIALAIGKTNNLVIGSLAPKHIVQMGIGFGLSEEAIAILVEALGKRLSAAVDAISISDVGSKELRDQLCDKMEKRWNGSFKSIGQLLSKRQSKGGKAKN